MDSNLVSVQTPSTLKQFFQTSVSDVFEALAINDQAVTTYVSDVLTNFAKADKLFRIQNTMGKRVETVVEMLEGEKIAAQISEAKVRDFRKYIGDYTLFMTGLFREYLTKDGFLNYYLLEGQKSYKCVANVEAKIASDDAPMFSDLADRFEFYSGALDLMKRTTFGANKLPHPLLEFANAMAQRLGTSLIVH